jgi:hypothetical protein
MTDSTYDAARRCPICNELGEKTGEKAIKAQFGVTRGAVLHEFTCRNAGRCRWANSAPYFVQVNPDGTIPPPNTNREKQFRALPNDHGATQNALENLQEATLRKQKDGQAAEVRGRY